MSTPGNAYLQTQVLTATPQRLRLMLIEAALRDADRTAELWAQGQDEPALEALIRCREIISELIAGIRPDASPLAQKVLGLYLFLFQALTEAQLSHDRQKLTTVRRVLTAERQTWQQVCRQMSDAPPPMTPAAEIAAPAVISPPASQPGDSALSLEA